LGCVVRWYALLSWIIVVQSTAVGAAIFLCLKCLFVFLLVVLVRVTTPKFKLETITKLG
jgi:NADH:ubiquinone oxidoreductase subunit H